MLEDGSVLLIYLGDSSSLFDNRLFLEAPFDSLVPIVSTRTSIAGAPHALGPFDGGTLLAFRDNARLHDDPSAYDFDFFTGTGGLNPDGLPHAVFTFDPDDPFAEVTVGFEDLIGGGDRDYNDLQFSLTNVGISLVPFTLPGASNPLGSSVTLGAGERSSLGDFYQTYVNAGVFANEGNVHVYGGFENSGTFTNSGDFFADLTSGIEVQFGSLLANEAGGTMFLGSLLGAVGPILQGVSGIIGAAKNAGTVTTTSGTDVSGTLTNEEGGRWINFGPYSNSGTTTNSGEFDNQNQVQNSGNFEVRSGGSVTGPGSYTQTGGSTTVDGTLGGSQVDIQGGSFGGSGTVDAPTTFGTQTTLNPGNSPGTLRFLDALAFQGGSINIEIGSASVFDLLDIVGPASFSGGTVNFLFQYTPDPGDAFTWLTSLGGLTGDSTLSYTVTGLDGLRYETRRTDNALSLYVLPAEDPTPVPEPGSLVLLAMGLLGLAAAVGWRRRIEPARPERVDRGKMSDALGAGRRPPAA